MFCFIWNVKQCAESINRCCDTISCHCVQDSHRGQEGSLLVVGQRTKEQPFPLKGRKKCFQNPQKLSLPHPWIAIHSWNNNWVSIYQDWNWAQLSLWDRGVVRSKVRYCQGPHSHLSGETAGATLTSVATSVRNHISVVKPWLEE